MYDENCPLLSIKASLRDPPYMTPIVKYLCKIRNKNIKKGTDHDLQQRINTLIRENQINSIRQDNRKHGTGSKKWWDVVNKITGRKSSGQNVSSVLSPSEINQHFLKRDKHRSDVLLSSTTTHTSRHPYSSSRGKHC